MHTQWYKCIDGWLGYIMESVGDFVNVKLVRGATEKVGVIVFVCYRCHRARCELERVGWHFYLGQCCITCRQVVVVVSVLVRCQRLEGSLPSAPPEVNIRNPDLPLGILTNTASPLKRLGTHYISCTLLSSSCPLQYGRSFSFKVAGRSFL